jgi:hypothetical protein
LPKVSQKMFPVIAGLLFTLPVNAADEDPLHVFEFAGQPGMSSYAWLEQKRFSLERQADDPKRIELYHADEALHIRVKRAAFGMVVHEQDILGARHASLRWGVSDFPEGASYEHGIDNEALMVYVFFGHERMDSGEMFVPDSPYFIGFYLCPAGGDAVDQPYSGNHYKKTGRYICMDHPAPGQSVETRIDLAEEFRKSFGIDSVPMVSGVSIEVDTTDSKNDGKAAAFIEQIAFYP